MSMSYGDLAVASLAFIFLQTAITAAQPLPWHRCNGSSGNYTENSTYQANIQYLATSLPGYASASPSLFASGKSGTAPDVIHALALCRGDTNATSCAACVAAAINKAQQICALVKAVTVYDDPCILRFSNEDFPVSPPYNKWMLVAWNSDNVSAAVAPDFDAAAVRLVNATADYAAADPLRRFGTGEEAFDEDYPKIYSLAQCTPDMTAGQCRSCLNDIIVRMMPRYLSGKTGGRVWGIRCNFRLETFPFFSGQPLLQLPTTTGERTDETSPVVVAIAVLIVAAVLASLAACFYLRRRRRRRRRRRLLEENTSGPNSDRSHDIRSIDSLLLDLLTLQVATDEFSEHNRLGEGGFGVVYKGILPEGQEIAVKRLSQTSRQGIDELKTELLLVAKLNHKNLVRLLGVCLEKHEKILVYEYMPNKSLDTILFDAERKEKLDWGKRFKIINGIARGLQYLHEDSQLKIVHRDLKASNILLDYDYSPKISDFGFAKIFGGDHSQIITHRIAGTYGYMSPEYAMRGQYSTKSDVFSFGVLILEIITGRRNFVSYDSEQDVDLINVAWEHWTRGKTIKMIDPSLGNHCTIDQFLKCIHIGLLCVQRKPADRPLMSAVNLMLSSSNAHIPSLSRPAFCTQETGTNSDVISEPSVTAPLCPGNATKVTSEVSMTELEPR